MWDNSKIQVFRSWLSYLGLFLAFLCGSNFAAISQVQKFQWGGFAQGTTYEITYFSEGPVVLKSQVDSLLEVIDESMSLYRSDSKIVHFNAPETQQMELDMHFSKVMNKAFEFHRKSGGLFDVTIGPLSQFWKTRTARVLNPEDTAKLSEILDGIGMRYLTLEGNRLTKLHPRVTVDLNGIAQGYTVDLLAEFFEMKGISNYVVEIGGEIRVKRNLTHEQGYVIGVPDPINKPSMLHLSLSNGAVTTSGKFSEKDHQIHHIDPISGYPVNNLHQQVTVIAQDATTADALDNVLMTWDEQEYSKFEALFSDIAFRILGMDPSGQPYEYISPNFLQFLKK